LLKYDINLFFDIDKTDSMTESSLFTGTTITFSQSFIKENAHWFVSQPNSEVALTKQTCRENPV